MQDPPSPAISLQSRNAENATASSVITLNDNTTLMEIAAVGAPAAIRWVATTDTQASVVTVIGTANYDHIIPSGTYRKFVVPQEVIGTSSIVGLNKQSGLYNRIAYKTIGVGSILSAEY